MSTAHDLADEYRRALDEAIEFASTCTAAQWVAVTSEEGWTVAATLHHIALGNVLVSGWIEAMLAGIPIEGTAADQDVANAEHAAEFANADRTATIALLRSAGGATEVLIRSLTEEKLGKAAPFGPAGGRELDCSQAAQAAVNHVRSHLGNARTAIDPAT